MTSGEHNRPTIDGTYTSVLLKQGALSPSALQLPHTLGLVGPGEGWECFIVTDVNRDLPRYAAQSERSRQARLVSDEQLGLFRRAHHCAVIYGLIVDRIADGQRRPTDEMMAFERIFAQEWLDTLGAACGSLPLATCLVQGVLNDLVAGNEDERAALEHAAANPGSLGARDYVQCTLRKLRWFGTSADGVLLARSEIDRHKHFRKAYDTFSIALQCIDDALDEASDRATRGASFPGALGMPAGALLAAGRTLIGHAAEIADEGRFHEFARWLTHVSRELARHDVPGDPLQVGVGAAVLCAATEEVIHAC